jgi:hypothetical protein
MTPPLRFRKPALLAVLAALPVITAQCASSDPGATKPGAHHVSADRCPGRAKRNGSTSTGSLVATTFTHFHTSRARLFEFEAQTALPQVGGCFLFVRNFFGDKDRTEWFVTHTESSSDRTILVRFLQRSPIFSEVEVVNLS